MPVRALRRMRPRIRSQEGGVSDREDAPRQKDLFDASIITVPGRVAIMAMGASGVPAGNAKGAW